MRFPLLDLQVQYQTIHDEVVRRKRRWLLPIRPELTDEQQDYFASMIAKFLGRIALTRENLDNPTRPQ